MGAARRDPRGGKTAYEHPARMRPEGSCVRTGCRGQIFPKRLKAKTMRRSLLFRAPLYPFAFKQLNRVFDAFCSEKQMKKEKNQWIEKG